MSEQIPAAKVASEEDRLLDEIVRVLTSRAPRLELERTWTGKPCIRLYERGETKGGNPKWTVVGPLLFGAEDDDTHAGVLRHLAGLIEQTAASGEAGDERV